MRRNKLKLYLHLVWTTWDRLPLITPEIERELHRHLRSEAEQLGCKVFAVNGVEDHIHLLLEIPPTLDISTLVQRLKGVSSHFVNQTLQAPEPLKWRASYAAFTVSYWNVSKIARYIKAQKEHHSKNTVLPEIEDE